MTPSQEGVPDDPVEKQEVCVTAPIDIDRQGIKRVTELPDQGLAELWDSIIVDQQVKDRLLSQAILNFVLRPEVGQSVLPLHGVILLVGAPGTGKTSLARGLATRIAESMDLPNARLVEVEAHDLTSSAMGRTQKAVTNLFAQTLSEMASEGSQIVLLDEVETLAVDRARLSLDANPVDIHRATDAVLVQLDTLAESHKNLLFVATSNYPEAVDDAFISRCDLVLEIPPPGEEACREILEKCLMGVSEVFPNIGDLVKDPGFSACAAEFAGLDGRAIRKTVVNALASRKELALASERMTLGDLAEAARLSKETKTKDGRA